MKLNIFYLSPLMLFVTLSCVSPQKEISQETHLGVLNHQFSISKPAQQAFERGLLLLHSFEYEDAREAFQEAISTDTTELMAYWGEALSYYKALWGLQNIDAGRAVLIKVGATKEVRLGKADNELERDFWEAAEILYGEGDLYQRNKAYADYMGKLYQKYPDNQEVAAFYALGLMWSVEGGRDDAVFDLSARVASGILQENPNHPGAMHYLIHANDDPDYAQLAKIAADQYAKVAPDATHALHMPSHIYLALGMWNEVVTSNEQSYQASINRMERKGLGEEARGYHSYAWLHYGYLQQGRFDKAEKLLKDMLVYVERTPNRRTKRYLIAMQNAQLVESGKWPTDLEPMYLNYSDLGLNSKASQHFFKAIRTFANKDVEQISNEIITLETRVATAELSISEDAIPVCSAGSTRYAPNKVDIVRANVMINQMKAMKAILNENDPLAEKHFLDAITLENQSAYSSGPPEIPYPSYEQYGEWLLDHKRPEDALIQFDRSLENAQNRAKALRGKMKAMKMLDRTAEAQAIKEILADFWQHDMVSIDS